MKKDIHLKYEEITASCSCGNVMKIRSTVGHDLNLDVCSKCHRSSLANSVMLLPVAVLTASTSVSTSRAANKTGFPKRAPHGAFLCLTIVKALRLSHSPPSILKLVQSLSRAL